ncbi:DNA-directed RNA polymerase I subunit RPA2-like [Oppia nitens]|uniref:DNA-directed RNA polymerase I subunit RPA2-like n=1 Tax=Oppia nitens TaxID=1686743 RepID=UPI0023DB1213|nr:DNA-directed RNA polymerase I subunit RPA2-like [Oppia nitens]
MAKNSINTDELLSEIQNLAIKPTQKLIHSRDYHDPNRPHAKFVQQLARSHIESFNFMIEEGLQKGIQNLRPLEFALSTGERIRIQIIDFAIFNPVVHKDSMSRTVHVYPSECRIRRTSYKGKLHLTFSWSIDGKMQEIIEEFVGEIPIMVKSNRCNIEKLTRKQLVKHKEDTEEFGGYFLVNGNERVVRLLTAQRRNYPLALSRKSWKDSGQLFSQYGISMRCVRPDQMGSNMILHYLTNGTARLRFWYARQPIYLPLIMVLKSLVDVSDKYIFNELTKGKQEDTYYKSCVTNMLRLVQDENLYTSQQIKKYIGERFRAKCHCPEWYTDAEVTDFLLRECVAVHLTSPQDKFNLLVFITRKLFALAKGECAQENPDNPMFHEIFLSGHIYFTLLLDRMSSYLTSVKFIIDKLLQTAEKSGNRCQLTPMILKKALTSKFSEITRPLEYLLSTGNLRSSSGLGIQQTAGITVMADKINWMRFLSHFRAVHRGAFFAEMKTTACRKLYPEAWGFLCPVHTPDGSPCGLLNHLAEMCIITNYQSAIRNVVEILYGSGMEPIDTPICIDETYLNVSLDGKMIGFIKDSLADSVVTHLRTLKATNKQRVPPTLEIGFVPKSDKATQYPGIYLFSTPARMMRPVFNLRTQTLELIGTFEQVYMDICVTASELKPGITTHQELKETSMLSVLATQIPYPDFNQSPRNMYSCQMGKQTMGTPSHTLKYRSDNKMYTILSPQSCLVRPTAHDYYEMDNYPLGTNAVVAVISYTGYDMEDAMILNKATVERGFKHGSIYKTEIVDLREIGGIKGYSSEIVFSFGRKEDNEPLDGFVDMDGLPFIGTKVDYGDPICSYFDLTTGDTVVKKYKSLETAYIYDVKLLGNDSGKTVLQSVAITYWIHRPPIIGDKFANRHGQKGVCSVLWPQENMPFTEGGMTPDIIFNPHGFPSRMTIGQMIESMAGKTGSMYGTVHDATPFVFSEDNVASDYFGKLLENVGFNYYGTERMYSGVDGRELEAEIFIGVIYYIRLRHMVGDKYQVRSTGPIDNLTHQPVKGRKRAGGIRFGEMERDSLLAHGTSFLLHDRLFNNSDKTVAYMCHKCSSLISPYCAAIDNDYNSGHSKKQWKCRLCDSSDDIKVVAIPYVLQYLVAELAAVNIKVKFDIKS